MSAVQLAFFPFRKPLLDLFGAEFFKSVPRLPGVYTFLSDRGRVLYVGQSKDLRTRLSYYKNARPDREPRRILRMIGRACSVQFEICACAEDAQARELQLIQKHRPTYNRALNGNPLHPFITLQQEAKSTLILRLTDAAEQPAGHVFGAFRSLGRCRMVLHAVARLCWRLENPEAGIWDLPLRLGGSSRAKEVVLSIDGEGSSRLHDYLAGTHEGLTEWLMPLPHQVRDPHLQTILENDLLLLSEFFATGPQLNRRIAEAHGIPPVIPREQLDALRLCTRKPE